MNHSGADTGSGPGRLRNQLLAHGFSMIAVAAVFTLLALAVNARRQEDRAVDSRTMKYLDLSKVDFGDPLDRALFRESLRMFYPGQGERNDSLMRAIDDLRQRQFTDPRYKSGSNLQGLTWDLAAKLGGMILQFVAVYLVVLVLVYVLAQRIGIYRFVKMKQHRESYIEQAVLTLRRWRQQRTTNRRWQQLEPAVTAFIKGIVKGILCVVLFSPAYVIAYSLRTSIDTSSLLFMALLGVASNGVLIYTANRFYALLVSESQKGYVQTALVKNLNASYEWNVKDGVPLRSLVQPGVAFKSHVFHHIFLNARFQFIPALKEQASFLVTGLVIIEMALNIHGHLCYELLQQILYRQYDVACAIIFSIFLVVKLTEIAIDIWYNRERRKYGY